MAIIFKAKSSFIEANLIIFGKKEINYLFRIDNNCILDTLQVIFNKNKLFFVWQNIESNIKLLVILILIQIFKESILFVFIL